jgi:hypothetical protein
VIKDVEVKDPSGAPLLSLKRLDLLVGTLDPLRQQFVIDRVSVDSPEIHARVSRQGTINWIEFFSQELAGRVGLPRPRQKLRTSLRRQSGRWVS